MKSGTGRRKKCREIIDGYKPYPGVGQIYSIVLRGPFFSVARVNFCVTISCADPESFVRGGPALTRFFFFFFFFF